MTSAAPVIGEEKASPQLLAWNIGTIGSTVSREDSPIASGCNDNMVCSTFERCE